MWDDDVEVSDFERPRRRALRVVVVVVLVAFVAPLVIGFVAALMR